MRSSSILFSLLLSFLPWGSNDRLFFWFSGHSAYLYIAKDHNTDLVLLPGTQIIYCGHDERDMTEGRNSGCSIYIIPPLPKPVFHRHYHTPFWHPNIVVCVKADIVV